jgi:hypothetical protein
VSASLARRIVVVSLVLGLLAVRLCFDLPIGINAPILTVLIFAGAWLTGPPRPGSIHWMPGFPPAPWP